MSHEGRFGWRNCAFLGATFRRREARASDGRETARDASRASRRWRREGVKYTRLDLRTGLDDEDAAVADDALDVLGSAERALDGGAGAGDGGQRGLARVVVPY